MIKPKKYLGQHFLKDLNIAHKIANSLDLSSATYLIEVGPGMGILTEPLLERQVPMCAIEIDPESVAYLKLRFSEVSHLDIIEADFLKVNILENRDENVAIVGNFPYNISSQIVFKAISHRGKVVELVGMFQKEVAERICASPGSKTYGILSVLAQAFYESSYLFTVSQEVFNPPPKVKSGVIKLTRRANYELGCNEELFFKVVKTVFGQRRKMLRNTLKCFEIPENNIESTTLCRRPEQLSITEFVEITKAIEAYGKF